MTLRQINVLTGEETTVEYTDVEKAAAISNTNAHNAAAPQREIERLERLETPRRLAESFSDSGLEWLNANRALIATERAKL